MTNIIPNISRKDLFKFTLSVGAKKIEEEFLRKRKADNRKKARDEFYYAIRPVFLKFLPVVDEETVRRFFSEKEIFGMQNYSTLPKRNEWNIHHQKPLLWGGSNLNPKFLLEAMKLSLTPEQEEECKANIKYPDFLMMRFKLTNYIEREAKKGHLEKAFCDLFKGVLILLPKDLHDELEENYIKPQEKSLPSVEERDPNSEVPQVLISYPTWDQFIYQGKNFDAINPNELHYKKGYRKQKKRAKLFYDVVERTIDKDEKKNRRREFYWPQKVSKKKRNYLRQKAENFYDFQHGD